MNIKLKQLPYIFKQKQMDIQGRNEHYNRRFAAQITNHTYNYLENTPCGDQEQQASNPHGPLAPTSPLSKSTPTSKPSLSPSAQLLHVPDRNNPAHERNPGGVDSQSAPVHAPAGRNPNDDSPPDGRKHNYQLLESLPHELISNRLALLLEHEDSQTKSSIEKVCIYLLNLTLIEYSFTLVQPNSLCVAIIYMRAKMKGTVDINSKICCIHISWRSVCSTSINCSTCISISRRRGLGNQQKVESYGNCGKGNPHTLTLLSWVLFQYDFICFIHLFLRFLLWNKRKSFRERLFYRSDGFGYGIYAWNQRNFSLKEPVAGGTNPSLYEFPQIQSILFPQPGPLSLQLQLIIDRGVDQESA